MNNKFRNIFTSKADVLEFLNNNIKNSMIEKLFHFTVDEWNHKENEIINKIKNEFNLSHNIVIRSSALGEDSLENSSAGLYDSILNVSPKSKQDIKNAIEIVYKSYLKNNNLNQKNQILIQNQTSNVNISGVVFTHTPDTGAPYFVINYEEGGTTTKTTHGLSNKVIKIYRNTKLSKIPQRWKQLISSIQELEKFCNSNFLDIEFGITNSQNVVIFQVRPMTSITTSFDKKNKTFHKILLKNRNRFSKLSQTSISNTQKIFSDMTDWNPAEIIGNSPNPLAYSLYAYLITNEIWHKSRTILDYHDVSPSKLMKKFGNKPYIDVNESFHSLIPNNFSLKLTKKLLNFYSKKLSQNIHLHDKAEFQILFTCYDFMLEKRLNELKNYNFSKSEINQIKQNLSKFTTNIFLDSEKIITNCQNELEKMIQRRNVIIQKLSKTKISHKEKIILLKNLLDDCKNYGTLSFSIMARLSFIGTILLKSYQEFTKSDSLYDDYLSSLSTPLTDIQNDFVDYKNKNISKENFLKKYGHLRPGTYDITNPTYRENEDFLSEINFSKKIMHKKTSFNEKNFSKLLSDQLNLSTSFSIMNFISTTIIQREKFKFEFTKNLSLALDLISDIARSHNFSKNEIANLEIKNILNTKNYTKSKIIKNWKLKINLQKDEKMNNDKLVLPQVLISKNDFEIINYHVAQPNYITNKIIKKSIIELKPDTKIDEIKNSILLIENADPGFDWIFTKNPAGLITKYGGVASHMAIRCAEIDLPAAIGTGELLFEKLRSVIKIQLDCKNQQIFVLEHENTDFYVEEKKILKSLGYIK
tara:strand:- start:669 stop:3104 length:2436 start_codon:yes stop_codon:yes gene_type:complete